MATRRTRGTLMVLALGTSCMTVVGCGATAKPRATGTAGGTTVATSSPKRMAGTTRPTTTPPSVVPTTQARSAAAPATARRRGTTPIQRAQTMSVALGREYDRLVGQGHSRDYAVARVNESSLADLATIHDPARTVLARGVVAWQEGLAAKYPTDGLGLEASEMRKQVAALGILLPAPLVKYAACPAGQVAVGVTGACAPQSTHRAGCFGPSGIRFSNLSGVSSCAAAIGVYEAFVAGAAPSPWTCAGDASAGSCQYIGAGIGDVTDSGFIGWG